MAVAGKKKIFDNKYEILSIVGRGSRSVVYHAKNVADDNSEVALKVLIENKKDTISNSEKLRREALAMVSSHHPSVIRLDDFHSVGDICYLSMEFAPEVDLRKYAQKTGGKVPVEQAENYLLQICEALEYIHRVGIIHRDIKPDNLLVVDDKQIRVGDFGVALLPGDENSPQDISNAVGTMDYMAPEVLEGVDYNQRSDIYSLGVSFYEMMSGAHPFAKASLSQQLEVRKDENIKPLSEIEPSIPQYLSEAIQRAMSYDPKERFSSAKEFLQHLKQKRTQKQPAIAPKKEERPQLTVIEGSAPEELEENPQPAEITDKPLIESPVLGSSEPTEQEEPISDQSEDPQESIMQAAPNGNIAPQTPPSQAAAGPMPLKDSRASRTPTVFIPKQAAEELRQEITIPSKVASRTITAQRTNAKPLPTNNSLTAGVVVVAVLLVILGWNVFSSHRSQNAQVAKLQDSTQTHILPAYEGEELSFPNLPKGIYSGAIKGILPDNLVPMTVVSTGDSNQLALIIGLDGWTPTVVTLSDSAPSAIRVVSNGFILEFSGQSDKGLIRGTVKNIISGTQGAFALKPS